MKDELFSVEGRVVVVTGASAGIGEVLARGLAAAGARVVVSARRRQRLAREGASLRLVAVRARDAYRDVVPGEAGAARGGPGGPQGDTGVEEVVGRHGGEGVGGGALAGLGETRPTESPQRAGAVSPDRLP